jgi:autotransporter-associated beta strand protein
MLTLSGTNTYSGTLAITGGTLALTGNNSGSTAAGTVSPGATLRLASANGFTGALALNSGSTLQLRADNNTTFAPASITLDNSADTNNFDAGPASTATGKTLTLSGALAFAANSSQTLNVTGTNNYTLVLGAVSATASTDHNPYRVVTINAIPGVNALIASFTAGNYGDFLNLNGGGNVTFTGNLGNTSNGSTILFVNGGTKATLQGLTAKSNTGDGYRYFVPNGVLVVDKNGALTNNTTGTGLNLSLFILGAATNFMASGSGAPAGFLIATNNSYNCAVYLGDANYPNGGLTLRANVTNYVSDGDIGFTNSGTFTIGGQNTSGVNTYANPIILGWTANRGKGVTLVAATGGTVNFAGNILANGTDTTAGVTVGDAAHGGIVKLTGTNTYAGPTTVSNGTLLVSGLIGSGAVTVASGAVLGGGGTIGGAVTDQSGGILAPGVGAGAAGTVLTVANGLILNSGSFTTMAVSHNNHTNDQIACVAIAYGGALTVTTNAGDGPLAAGDSFQLFKANSSGNYSGSFSATNLPALGPGLGWSNSLAVNGSIEVVSNAVTAPAPVAGFTGTPTNLFVTQTVVFMDASTGSITNWGWSFGDGHAATNNSNANVTNTYGVAGSYTVSLVVSGAGGSSTNTRANYVVVKPKAAISGAALSSGGLVFSGTNGPAGMQYRILTTTNVSLPLANWTPVVTNVFAADGSYSYTNAPGVNPAGFFLLVSP